MPHPLDIKIASLRRKARLTYVVFGACCALAMIGAVAVAAAATDFLLRYEELGIRLASSLAVAGVCGWAMWRFVWPAVIAPLDDIFLARQIERRYPMLRERLSGAVAFLQAAENDPHAGSSRLRQAVIHDTTTDALRLPLTDVLRSRPAVLAMVAALLVTGGIVALSIAWPTETRIGASRLLLPWSDVAWPRKYEIKVTRTERGTVAVGHRFRVEAELIDRTRNVPTDGDITILYGDPTIPLDERKGKAERHEMQWDHGRRVYQRENVTRNFCYCAIASDADDTQWINVVVKEAPIVRELGFTVEYPGYTNWQGLETGLRPAETPLLTSPLPAGSKVRIVGRATKPVGSVVVSGGGATERATIDADQLGFSLVWNAEKSVSLRFKLIEASSDGSMNDDGLPPVAAESDETLQEILVEAESPPWVKLVEPRASPEDPHGDIIVTAKARVRVAAEAGDAFTVLPGVALSGVAIKYARSDRSAESDQTIEQFQYRGPAIPITDDASLKSIVDAAVLIRQDESRTVPLPAGEPGMFDLAPLELPPGTFVTIYATASDYQPVERISSSRRLRVVSSEEFLEHFNERQRDLHAALNKVRADQESARAKTADARQMLERPDADEQARKQAKEALREAGNLQQRIAAELGLAANQNVADRENAADNRRGIQGRVADMLEDLGDNRLDNREVERRLGEIAGEIKNVADNVKPQEITDNLTEAANGDQADPEQRRDAADALTKADQSQQRMLNSLDAMLKNLAEWDDYGKFHEDLARIKGEQEKLAAETREHLRRQLGGEAPTGATGRSREEEQAAKRDELAARQSALSRRFEQFQQQMRQNSEARNLKGAEAVDRAIKAADQANPAGAMREAGQMLRDNQLNKAPERQQAALDRLREVMQALSAERIDDLNRLVSKLKAAESELAKLAAEQRGLASKLRDAEKIADKAERERQLQTLSKQQRELQQKTAQLAEQLKRLKAERSAAGAARGGDQMSGAGEKADQGDAAGAADQAEAAKRDLEDAQRQLAQERRQAEADLAREVAARLEDDIQAAIARQQHVVEEIKRFETLRTQSQLTRAAQIGILDLAEEQATLEGEARAAAERLGSAPAFKLALDGAADDMSRTASRLRERLTDAVTLRYAENVVRRYQRLLDAVKPRKGSQRQGGGEGEQGQGGEGGQQGGGESSNSISELVLIKLMQEDVNLRTKELDAARSRGGLSPEETEEFQRLGDEQGKLADLLIDMIGETEDATRPDADVDLKDSDLKLDDPPPVRKPAPQPGETE